MSFWKDRETIYADSHWKNHRFITTRYYFDRGYLRTDQSETYGCEYFYEYKDRLVEWFSELGYDNKYFDYKFVENVLNPFIGRPVGDVEESIKERARFLRGRREKRKTLIEFWNKLDEQFKGYVVSLDNEIDVYRTGFSIRVLLSSRYTFAERRAFVKTYKKDLVLWAIEQLKESKKAMNKIGDLRFYKPVEIITLRSPEVEIKFEIKDTKPFEEKDDSK